MLYIIYIYIYKLVTQIRALRWTDIDLIEGVGLDEVDCWAN